jgi:hypothetical protein
MMTIALALRLGELETLQKISDGIGIFRSSVLDRRRSIPERLAISESRHPQAL